MKGIKLVKNRSDIGAGTRGSDLGIDAIEVAAINADNDYFIRYPYVDVPTHNASIYTKVHQKFAKRIEFVHEQCERVAHAVKTTLDEGYFALVMSGDHSSAMGSISGVKAHFYDKRVGVIWIDAHADLHSPFTTPSGNVHGMPMAAVMGKDNRDYQINVVTDHTKGIWNQLKNVGVEGPKILPRDLIYFGVRDTEAGEDALIAKHDLRLFSVAEVRYRRPEVCVAESLQKLSDCDVIYISFDVDCLDPGMVSRGTGTPVAKGFDPEEVSQLIKGFMDSGKVVCLEISEVNPLLDYRGNRMAETAFDVLDDLTKYMTEHVIPLKEGVA